MIDVESLLDVPGFSPEAVEKLRPFVTVLPTHDVGEHEYREGRSDCGDGAGHVAVAGAGVRRAPRDRVFPRCRQCAARADRRGRADGDIDPNQMDVTTNYFLIHGRVQHERCGSRPDDLAVSRSGDAFHAYRLCSRPALMRF